MANTFDEQGWRNGVNAEEINPESEKKVIFLKYLGLVISLLSGSQGSEEKLRFLQTVTSQLESGETLLSDEAYDYFIAEIITISKEFATKFSLIITSGLINLSGNDLLLLQIEALMNQQTNIESQNISVYLLMEDLNEYSRTLPNIEMIDTPPQLELSTYQKEDLINQAQHGVAQVAIEIFSDLNKVLARCKTIEEFQSIYPQVYSLMANSFFPRLFLKVSTGTSDELEFSNPAFHNEIIKTIQNGKNIKLGAAIRNIPSVNSLDFVKYFETFFEQNQEAANLIHNYLKGEITANIREEFDFAVRFDLANHSPQYIIEKMFSYCIDESSRYINGQKAIPQAQIKAFIELILRSNIEISVSSIFTIANLLKYSNYPSSSNASDPIYRVVYDHLGKVLTNFLIREFSSFASFKDINGLENLGLNAFGPYLDKLNLESPSTEACEIAQNVTEIAKNQGLRIGLSKSIEIYLQKNIINNIERNIDNYRYSDEFFRQKIETEYNDLAFQIKDFLMRGTDLGDESANSIKRKLSNYYDTLYLECGEYANHTQIREVIENSINEILESHFENLISRECFESFFEKITTAIISKEASQAIEARSQENQLSDEMDFDNFAKNPFIKNLPQKIQKILWNLRNGQF